jgi:uncharacterized protein (TIGR04255 family)
MSCFKPLNADHAISAAAFSLNFASALGPAAIEKAKEIEPTVKEFLPGVSVIPGMPANMLLALTQPPKMVSEGIVFQRVKPDGTPAWLLTAQQNFVSAHCMEYTRWEEVWTRVRDWLLDLYLKVKTDELALYSISLQYVDQFLADNPVDDSTLDELFRPETEYLPRRTFKNQSLWHVNQGWYSTTTKPVEGRALNVLNITARGVEDRTVLNIDHLMRCEVKDPRLELFAGDPKKKLLIDSVMEDFHAQNKGVLRDLLSDQMRKLIHLDG